MTGVFLFDLAADKLFSGAVGSGHGGIIRFVIGPDAGVKITKGNFPGAVSQVGGEIEIGLQIHKETVSWQVGKLRQP